MGKAEEPEAKRHFFVDEAGDLTLFDKRGRVIVGRPGVSRCFLVGFAEIPDPNSARERLDGLRNELLNDPYFAGVPSMQLDANKTAIAFHAKDDVAEVRREVFKLIPTLGARVFVAFRRKSYLAQEFLAAYQRTGRRWGADTVYDKLITLLFENRLHQADENVIVFAMRGKSERNAALRAAIEMSKWKFERKWKKGIDRPTTITVARPSASVGLQVADYYLWALQRMLERGEDRFFELLRGAYKLLIDVDDTRQRPYGMYYSSSKPFSLDAMMPVI